MNILKSFTNNFKNSYKCKNKSIFILNIISVLLTVGLQLFIQIYYINYVPRHLFFISIIILLTYLYITLFSLFRTGKLEIISQDLEKERICNKTLSLLYDNIRCFKHDFNNNVQAIGGYITSNNMDGLKAYYNDLLDDCQKVNTLEFLNPDIINNPAIYSILTDKYYKTDENGIKMNLNISTNLESLNIKPYILTKILGILLDNAIEASSQCDKKIINVTFRKDTNLNRDLIIIENSYTNKDVNIDEIFEKGYSSKTDEDDKNHGLGLWEVRKLLNKCKNLNLFTSKDFEYFKQQLEIYN